MRRYGKRKRRKTGEPSPAPKCRWFEYSSDGPVCGLKLGSKNRRCDRTKRCGYEEDTPAMSVVKRLISKIKRKSDDSGQ